MDWNVTLGHVKPQMVSCSLTRLLDGAGITLEEVVLHYFKTNVLENKEYVFGLHYPCETEAVLSMNYNTEFFDDLIGIAKGYNLDQGVDELFSKYFISWNVGSFAPFYMINLESYLKGESPNPIFKGSLPNPMSYDPKTIITSKEFYPKRIDNQVAHCVYQTSNLNLYLPTMADFKKNMKEMMGIADKPSIDGDPFEGDPMFSENTRYVGTVL
jgi:hypothetical protein